jgi:aspartate dehydrogenase
MLHASDSGQEAMTGSNTENQRVAIAGFGAIGMRIARALDAGIPGYQLAAVSAHDRDKAQKRLSALSRSVPVVSIEELEPLADVVIECAPAALLPSIAAPFLRNGKTAIVLSAGALLSNEDLIALAKGHGGQIVVPTGALLGLDAVTAAAEGEIKRVTMISRKPIAGLLGAPHLVANGINIEDITEPMRVFRGNAREAAVGFPANLNVAVALSLAGIGPDRTIVEMWADPSLTRNTHTIQVEADSASFSMSIENVPSENPKTGVITALSVISYLRKTRAALRVGS